MESQLVQQKSSEAWLIYHEGIPRHGGEELIEQISESQFFNHAIITIQVNDGLIKIENHHSCIHFDWTCFVFLREARWKKKAKKTQLFVLKDTRDTRGATYIYR